mgnify:CR=1 FL=1
MKILQNKLIRIVKDNYFDYYLKLYNNLKKREMNNLYET